MKTFSKARSHPVWELIAANGSTALCRGMASCISTMATLLSGNGFQENSWGTVFILFPMGPYLKEIGKTAKSMDSSLQFLRPMAVLVPNN
jgi:hypothetical protein